jgi:hypothetical protein
VAPRRRKRLVSSWSRKVMPMVGVPATPAPAAAKDAGKLAAKPPAAAAPPVKRAGACAPLARACCAHARRALPPPYSGAPRRGLHSCSQPADGCQQREARGAGGGEVRAG